MKIREIYVEGFGIFRDFHVKSLPPGLTLFRGPNEAGKSTLLNFHKAILFGFPERRGKNRENNYQLSPGGSHGGRLVLVSEEGRRYVVERYAGRSGGLNVIMPDGSSAGEEMLAILLGNTDRRIFENLYAFGLSRLQDFRTLDNETIKTRLYSAGKGLGADSIATFERNVVKRMEELFRPRGKAPSINSLFREIRELDEAISDIKADVNSFDRLHKEKDSVEMRLDNLKKQRKEKALLAERISGLIKAWSYWLDKSRAEEELRDIPEVRRFPENGVQRLDTLLKKRSLLHEQIAETGQRLQQYTIERDYAVPDRDILANREEIFRLWRGQERFQSTEKESIILARELEKDSDSLREALSSIGKGWSEDDLSRFNQAMSLKEEARRRDEKRREVEARISGLRDELTRAASNMRVIEQDISSLSQKIEEKAGSDQDEKLLREKKGALRSIRTGYPLLKEKEAELKNLRGRMEMLKVIASGRRGDFPTAAGMPVAYRVLKVFLAVAVILVFSASIYLAEGAMRYIFMAGALLVAGSAAIIAFFAGKRPGEGDGVFSAVEPEGIEALEKEIAVIREKMTADAALCGFAELPDMEVLEKLDSELNQGFARLQESSQLESRRSQLLERLSLLREENSRLEKELEALMEEAGFMEGEWNRWLSSHGFVQGLTMEGLFDILQFIEKCREKQKIIADKADRLDSIYHFLEGYRTSLKELLARCRKGKEIVNAAAQAEALYMDLRDEEEKEKRAEQIEVDYRKAEIQISRLKEEESDLCADISELLSAGGADGEDDFRKNAAIFARREILEGHIGDCLKSIRAISGEGRNYELFLKELRRSSPAELKREEASLEEELAALDKSAAILEQEKGGISKEIEQIENRQKGSILRIQRHMAIEKLNSAAHEWSMLAIAETIFKKAIARYERERQPGVIKDAQEFFSMMTLGRYTRIYIPASGEGIYVEDNTGERKDMASLSRGTAEQLYLALRFGLLRDLASRSEPLPVILDEILVNFDPERCRAACRAIASLAETHQVLYFTCHPWTADLLADALPELEVIDL